MKTYNQRQRLRNWEKRKFRRERKAEDWAQIGFVAFGILLIVLAIIANMLLK